MPVAFVVASWVGLLAVFSLSVAWPFGLDLAVVGSELSVSAISVRLLAVTGVDALLSMYASESVMATTTAMPAPDPAASASAFEVTFVLTLDLSNTSEFEVEPAITLVSDSCVVASASTNAATTAESFCCASVQGSEKAVMRARCIGAAHDLLRRRPLLPAVADDVALEVVGSGYPAVPVSAGTRVGLCSDIDRARERHLARGRDQRRAVHVHIRVVFEVERTVSETRVASVLENVLRDDRAVGNDAAADHAGKR